MRIVVLGYVVRGALAGNTWHHLQYVLGLTALGHDVYFVEDSDDYESCYNPIEGVMTTNPAYGLRYADLVFRHYGLTQRWGFFDAHTNTWHGPAGHRATSWCRTADVIINVSGVNPLRPWCDAAPCRVLVDTDPAFMQIRHLENPAARDLARQHTHFRSFGENIGTASTIPNDGLPWQRTRQPIVLDMWTPTSPPSNAPFTTVMQWDSYPAAEHCGRTYGMKSSSFPAIEDLPSRTSQVLELALGSANAPRERLTTKGWRVRDPIAISANPWIYQHYIAGSAAELTVAKHGYIVTNSGWFSERSACYLASGRPVITQDTGFRTWMDVGEGVLTFTDNTSAGDAIRSVINEPARHCAAARRLAEAHFDSAAVLRNLIGGL